MNGVYRYGTTSQFPTQGYRDSNYWVDVLFERAAPPPALQAIAVAPASPSVPVGGTQQLAATALAGQARDRSRAHLGLRDEPGRDAALAQALRLGFGLRLGRGAHEVDPPAPRDEPGLVAGKGEGQGERLGLDGTGVHEHQHARLGRGTGGRRQRCRCARPHVRGGERRPAIGAGGTHDRHATAARGAARHAAGVRR